MIEQKEIEAFLHSAGWERKQNAKSLAFYKDQSLQLPGGTVETRSFRVRFNKQSTTVEMLMRRSARWLRMGGAPFTSTKITFGLYERDTVLVIGSYKITRKASV